ncbi:MAG TPA: hypothetical protein VD788_03640 [Candidatus Polarisedimenticolaceae bacterium]|nr:hypothetical protein [Candidatus Polarisedimenticolaceae bacterium]
MTNGRRAAGLLLSAVWFAAPGAAAQNAVHHADGWQYSFGNLGYFDGRTGDGLRGSDAGFAIGGGVGRRHARHLAFAFDSLFAGRSYDTPTELQFADDEMFLTNLVLTGNVQAIVPFWLFEGYVGFGLGLMISELEVPSSVIWSETATSRSSFDLSTQILVGIDFVYTRRSRIGVEFRNIFATADFDELSRGGVDVGGRLVAIKIKLPL